MAKSRANKANRRHKAVLRKDFTQKELEERTLLHTEIPHQAYGSVLVVLDHEIQERSQRFRTGLKVARDMPIYTEPAELPETDPYVLFYRSFVDAKNEPLFSVQVAQNKAHSAYQGQLQDIAQSSVILALLYYTTFEGELPEVNDAVPADEMLEAGLPPNLVRGMWSPLEQKLDHVKHMSVTDQEFASKLTSAVNAAVAQAQSEGLMGTPAEEEEKDQDGFQPPATD
jgi:hypothetical protein